jgi:cyclohexadieny/prephenate dehydrogenase
MTTAHDPDSVLTPTRIDTLLVIGLGLIGGSLAAALRGQGFARRFTAFNRSRASLDFALAAGIIDAAPATLEQAIAEADLIVVGVPTLTVGRVFETIRDHARSDAVITDVASVKGSVVAAAQAAFGRVPARLVPGHPIAGAEKSGVEAARADLFRRHRVILTPLADSDPDAVSLVDEMWRLTGADVVRMDVNEHDRVLAMTSHLPHVLAFTLVDTLARQPASDDMFRFAAGGFRDFTRIASSDVVMWRDIALANRDALLVAIDSFTQGLSSLRSAVAGSDAEAIEQTFASARLARERYLRWLDNGSFD